MSFFSDVCRWLEGGEDLVLAAILVQSGSTPRSAGALMAVRKDGRILGTIGGGVVEAMVMREARALLKGSDASLLKDYDLTNDQAASAGMICGGTLSVCLVRVLPAHAGVLAAVETMLAAGKRGVLLWPLGKGGESPGLLTPDGPAMDEELAARAKATQRSGAPALIGVGANGAAWLALPLSDAGTAVIVGAGHVAQQTARLTAMAGFRTVVLDDRADFANTERFPDADQVKVLDSFAHCFAGLELGPETYFIIVTRGHAHDKQVLAQALRQPAAYVGMIGSRKKRDATYAALLGEGVAQADIDRVHCPIGLSIGAETPEEIAVSIAAELIQARAERRAS